MLSDTEDYKLENIYEDDGDLVYEIKKQRKEITGTIRLSYNEDNHLEKEIEIDV
ncbi:hypothetical protein [Candidatus Nanohalobium constans]|uniref:Uncharacterized protein n=1 Tax=Candidatus Nanohalobium constans TaxID=2565781 RepID=A0A5Q0UFX6_9ARCH|nr:hypothetical protein [Candidatus Nanohalobium constans]QGA80454.1 hypothetical protein LC1Nh_0557 [Candidatus Nanohalobium constans]